MFTITAASSTFLRGLPAIVYLRTAAVRRGRSDGWPWFSIAALLERPITIYGDGLADPRSAACDDIVAAYKAAAEKPDRAAGQIFNMGGGPSRRCPWSNCWRFWRSGWRRKFRWGTQSREPEISLSS